LKKYAFPSKIDPMEQTLHDIRHSLAHLLAMAALEHDPEAKLSVGPAIDNGFYYDILFSEGKAPGIEDLPKLEALMRKLVAQNLGFEREEVTHQAAKERFFGNPFKLAIIEDKEREGVPVTCYHTGDFTDLCAGGHINTTAEIDPKGFALTNVSGAYWRGDEKSPMLTRIYGLAFENKEALTAYQEKLEEAKKRDHKKLGPELDLFFIDEKVGKGLPLWTPKGTVVKHELMSFARELEKKYGYEHVETPYIGSENLYKTSGHLDHYTSSMYAPIDMDGEKYYLRPMACPHHIRVFQRKPWSYKDLPIRYAEIADYNRYEKSGELMGMIRVRKFQLTDGHIFVTNEQLKEEFQNVCRMIEEGMKELGIIDIVSYRFSKRDPKNKEKYYPDDTLWDNAEGIMREALDELGFNYTETADEAAFYGPKLDVQAKNVNGKEDTLFTAQMDFLLPEKFDIRYTDVDGTKKRPVMIHRSTIGALERLFGFLIEHFAGAFPLWLAPVQITLLPVSEKFLEHTENMTKILRKNNIRVELDASNESLGKRIRSAKNQKVPYVLVIGEKEVSTGALILEGRADEKVACTSVHEAIDFLTKKIRTRSL
jgi:threonyl-tRNA synthetase